MYAMNIGEIKHRAWRAVAGDVADADRIPEVACSSVRRRSLGS
jgi:hypothetical protein